jgi:hypothetical protein
LKQELSLPLSVCAFVPVCEERVESARRLLGRRPRRGGEGIILGGGRSCLGRCYAMRGCRKWKVRREPANILYVPIGINWLYEGGAIYDL